MRIMAATPVPTNGYLEPECIHSIIHQDLPEGVTVDWEFVRGHEVFVERNELVRMALEGGYDKVLFVDSDVMVPLDAVSNMLETGKDVVMGFVPMKNTKTGHSAVYRHGSFFDKDNRYTMDEAKALDGPVDVKGGGFGCVMVDCRIFSEMQPPWFVYSESQAGIRRGEDLHFCYKAADMGVRIFADPRVVCKHKRSDWL